MTRVGSWRVASTRLDESREAAATWPSSVLAMIGGGSCSGLSRLLGSELTSVASSSVKFS